MLAGHAKDEPTLRRFLQKSEALDDPADRIWVMDRGILTEEVLAEMRASDPPVPCLVGTPKGLRSKLETALTEQPWAQVLEKFAAVPTIDVPPPTTDGRQVVFTRSTQPEDELKLLLRQPKTRGARASPAADHRWGPSEVVTQPITNDRKKPLSGRLLEHLAWK